MEENAARDCETGVYDPSSRTWAPFPAAVLADSVKQRARRCMCPRVVARPRVGSVKSSTAPSYASRFGDVNKTLVASLAASPRTLAQRQVLIRRARATLTPKFVSTLRVRWRREHPRRSFEGGCSAELFASQLAVVPREEERERESDELTVMRSHSELDN